MLTHSPRPGVTRAPSRDRVERVRSLFNPFPGQVRTAAHAATKRMKERGRERLEKARLARLGAWSFELGGTMNDRFARGRG